MTTTTVATRTYPGVTALPHPCWVLINPETGSPYADDRLVSHFDTERDAKDYSDPSVDARQLDAPCFVATPECGERFESDGTVLCFPSVESAIENLDPAGWRVIDGRLCCEDCGEVCGQ